MNKNINSRNTMNDKMNDFITPNFLNKNNNNNNESFQDTRVIYDKNNSKNDINTRLNNFKNFEDINLRRLPFNNNIRDYIITVDSKRDEVNDRLSNYNHLSSNINNPIMNNNNNYSFHNNFKDDTNKRMEELSPLARNTGMPINSEKPKVPDFSNNLNNNNKPFIINNKDKIEDNNNNIEFNNSSKNIQYNNDYSLLNDGINNISGLNYNSLYPCNTRQNYNFSQ